MLPQDEQWWLFAWVHAELVNIWAELGSLSDVQYLFWCCRSTSLWTCGLNTHAPSGGGLPSTRCGGERFCVHLGLTNLQT